jgi:hypothetical protein
VKTAMIYFVAALSVGAVQAILRVPFLGPTYVHMLVVGWITQMIFGVAYWMFPKYSPETPRGNNTIAIATFVLLNVGLLVRVFTEPALAWRPDAVPGWPLAVAGVAQALAGVGFAINTWPRVKIR